MFLRSHLASYAVVLSPPHVARTFGAALVGRLSYGVVFLSLVLAVSRVTGSYAVAGGVIALFGLTSSLLSPFRARLIDRHGPRKALPPMTIFYAGLLGALAAMTWQAGAPRDLLWITGAACGACSPPLGPLMRTLWGVLVPDRELLQRAYSLDTVAEELLYTTGPLLAGLFAAYANPALGVAISAGLILTGALALVSSPVVRNRTAPSQADGNTGSTSPAAGPTPAPRVKTPRVKTWYRHSVVVSAGLGACLGALSLIAVAFAGQHHHIAAVAWVEAALAVSSAMGGLLYGAFRWQVSLQTRLLFLTLGLSLFVILAGQSPDIYVLVAVVGAAGLFIAPILTSVYLIADEAAAPGARAQAGAWVNTAYNVGNSAGIAGIGLLISRFPLAACFAVAAAATLLPATALAVSIGKRRKQRSRAARTSAGDRP
jgi:predicted MFS family arabinose efflux permease